MLLHLQGLFSQGDRSIQAVVQQLAAAGLYVAVAADETIAIVTEGLQHLKDVHAPAALLAAHAALEGQVAVFWLSLSSSGQGFEVTIHAPHLQQAVVCELGDDGDMDEFVTLMDAIGACLADACTFRCVYKANLQFEAVPSDEFHQRGAELSEFEDVPVEHLQSVIDAAVLNWRESWNLQDGDKITEELMRFVAINGPVSRVIREPVSQREYSYALICFHSTYVSIVSLTKDY